MRIIYFLPDIEAGVSRIVKNLLKYRPSSNEVTYSVVLIRRKGQVETPANNNFNADEIIRFSYAEEENAFTVFKRLSKTIVSEKDIIVGNDGFEIKMVATMKLLNPVVYIVHGDFPYYYSILKTYHPVINSIICYSNKIENEVTKIVVAKNILLHKIYYPAAVAANNVISVRNRDQPFKILYTGLVIERKGADLLPAIYEGLTNKNITNFELEIIGEGDLLPIIKTKLEKFSNVKFSGWRDSNYINKQMSKAHIFLFPTRLEGLPNVLVEALANGAVPVTSNLESGITDFLVNDENALLIEKNKVDAFVEAIVSLYQNPDYLIKLQTNANTGLNKFEPYKQSAKYENVYLIMGKQNITKRNFPNYVRGRFLDRSWLPVLFVKTLRRIIKNPKL